MQRRRPVVLFVLHSMTPYSAIQLNRLAKVLTGAEVVAVLTHGQPNQPWEEKASSDVRLIEPGELTDLPDAKWRSPLKRWSVGSANCPIWVTGLQQFLSTDMTILCFSGSCLKAGLSTFRSSLEAIQTSTLKLRNREARGC